MLGAAGRAWCAAAVPIGSAGEFQRIPLSVRQQGGGGAYAEGGVMASTENPALMFLQTRTIQLEATEQLMFGGSQSVWGLGGSWVGVPENGENFGGALMVSGLSLGSIRGVDISGEATGEVVDPNGYALGCLGGCRWRNVSFALGSHVAYEPYGQSDSSGSPYSGVLRFGTMAELGDMTVGAALAAGLASGPGGLAVGGTLSPPVLPALTIGGEWNVPWTKGVPSFGGGGVAWRVLGALRLRSGLSWEGSGSLGFRAGLSVSRGEWGLDYAMRLPFGASSASSGVTQMIGMTWAFGRTRIAWED